tara:strand:+ start:4296 stop:4562 length:267 start_codon:yes stop_codon:yes gene_type:complete
MRTIEIGGEDEKYCSPLFEHRAEYLTDRSQEGNFIAAVAIHAKEVTEALRSESKVLRELVLLNIERTSDKFRFAEIDAHREHCGPKEE